MLHYSVVFFIIALIAAALGFGGIAGSAVGIAKVLFFAFLILSIISFFLDAGVNLRVIYNPMSGFITHRNDFFRFLFNLVT